MTGPISSAVADVDSNNALGLPALPPPPSRPKHAGAGRKKKRSLMPRQPPSSTSPVMMQMPMQMMMQMNDPTTGQYHPDFMFCGSCSTCKDPDPARMDDDGLEQLHPEDRDNDDLREQKGNGPELGRRAIQRDNSSVITRSKFNLLRSIATPSQALVIQSLLQPLPGVVKVVMPQTKHPENHHVDQAGQSQEALSNSPQQYILVDHDASTSLDSILSALEGVGHKAVLQANQAPSSGTGEPLMVRSQFAVRGVCCASEVPLLRRIVLPIQGVSKLQVNLTTKAVYIQHDINIVTAQHIAKTLTHEGFPAKVKKDGSSTVAAQRKAMNHGRTTLQVITPNVLDEQDIGPIQLLLSQIPGVSRIGINIHDSLIHVDHDLQKVSSMQCVQHLKQQANYECQVAVAAEEQYPNELQRLSSNEESNDSTTSKTTSTTTSSTSTINDALYMTPMAMAQTVAALEGISRSNYVESTITMGQLEVRNWDTLRQVIAQKFSPAQVRAVYPNVLSHTIKVEHDPKLVSIWNVCDVLDMDHLGGGGGNGGYRAKVTVNGADLHLYLPCSDDDTESATSSEEDSTMDPLAIHSIRLNVIFSGVFWFISILGYVGGEWEFLKWFGLASVFCGLPPILVKAWRTLRRFQLDANCMMVSAAIGACLLGEFDEAASVSFLFAVSEFLEARATLKARRALSAICSLRPDHANVIHPVTKELVVVPADRVPLGSLISVKTGDKIATDGIVVEGSSAVDESSLTGESKPVHKQVEDYVSGGTINIGTTQLVVRTTTTVEDSAVARLIRLVEDAQSNRSPTEKMIDTFARSYTPFVVGMAAIMCSIPWMWGDEIGRNWTLNGLIIIVIACPCALTISTPVTYAAALAATAQRGIIVKGGANLEAMGSVDKIIFDKTGTLTQGKFSVVHLEVIGANKTRTEMLEILALLQGRSSHPLSATLVQAAKREGISVPTHMSVTDHSLLKGEGVTAKIDGVNVYAGNQRLFARLGWFDTLSLHYKDLISNWEATGGTVGLLGTEVNGIIGAFCVKDSVREEANAAIQKLTDAGIEVIMCTGDSHAAAFSVAHELNIPRSAVHSQLLPEDKLHFVGSLKRPQPSSFGLCRSKKYVMFIGDGVNDAPALAAADIGVSMGEGAAMAMEMSDVTLMDSNLAKLPYVIHMGRRVVATVRENIIVSFVSKLAIVALTFMGRMTLLWAIAADVGVMLVVTLNGMKLLPGHATDVNCCNCNFSSEQASTCDHTVTLETLKRMIWQYDSVPTQNPTSPDGKGTMRSPSGNNSMDHPTQANVEMMAGPTHANAEIV